MRGAGCSIGVYPRVCGGTPADPEAVTLPEGLSPRVRGNPCLGRPRAAYHGSIPACAGEPTPAAHQRSQRGVYPRVCGGTLLRIRHEASASGLSPRVRGNHFNLGASAPPDGSIPACAGEPWAAVVSRAGTGVYPRVCGGTASIRTPLVWIPGLSPRVRGNPHGPRARWQALGSIPACAGEPPGADTGRVPVRVYPRVCGGTHGPGKLIADGRGLSPRVRGNHCRVLSVVAVDGSIPACAGEPLAVAEVAGPYRVYPRVCGGTDFSSRRLGLTGGLSPRVRGNPVQARVRARNSGSIPACAGEP